MSCSGRNTAFPPVWDKRKGHGHRACDTQGRSSDAPDTFSRNKSSDVLKNKFSFEGINTSTTEVCGHSVFGTGGNE